MTDSELNEAVAKIEGWEPYGYEGLKRKRGAFIETRPTMISYTTDWEWCGPLIEKYKLRVTPAPLNPDEWWCSQRNMTSLAADTPQQAICLAVIASHDNAA